MMANWIHNTYLLNYDYKKEVRYSPVVSVSHHFDFFVNKSCPAAVVACFDNTKLNLCIF
jgi:hypothetical protein